MGGGGGRGGWGGGGGVGPPFASATYEDFDNEFRFQANRKTDIFLKVRQHEDGRALVYGTYSYDTAWQHERSQSFYAGRLCEAGADLPVVIREVGELLAEKCGHEALGELMDDCIANLPEVDLA